jgi:hypothetical protein
MLLPSELYRTQFKEFGIFTTTKNTAFSKER